MSIPVKASDSKTILMSVPGLREEPDYTSILQNCLISIDDNILVPPICIEIILDEIPYTVGTLGNFSLLIGKAKAGKTFALSLLLACSLLHGQTLQGLLKAVLSDDKKTVIYFDTEQSKYHVQKVLKRICSISNISSPINFLVYSLRGLTPVERLSAIEYALYNTSNVGLVAIDGIRDLISSINDEEQSTMIASKLLKWTQDLNIHIITVLHQNKGDLNARGHLGSELTNKSETVLSITKSIDNKDISVVQPEYCRDKDFQPFAFTINEMGLPMIVNDWTSTIKASVAKKSTAPYEVDPSTHVEIIKDVFSTQIEMIRSELRIAAKANISRWLGLDPELGLNKTDSWITHWIQFKYIVMSGTPGTRSAKYRSKSQKTELT